MSKDIIEKLCKININRIDMREKGFSLQKYDDVLRGKSSYKIPDILEISEKFQISTDYLLGRQEDAYAISDNVHASPTENNNRTASNHSVITGDYTALTNDEKEILEIYRKMILKNKASFILKGYELIESEEK